MTSTQYWSGDLIDRIFAEDFLCIPGTEPSVFGVTQIANRILTERQLQVFNLRFTSVHGATMRKAADTLGISAVAILKIERRLIKAIKKELDTML